jgi:transcriptional regulator with XRE-family HTH domain
MNVQLPEIRPEERTPLVEALLDVVRELLQRVDDLEATNGQLSQAAPGALLLELESRRKELGMSIEALVRRSGVSRATVRRLLLERPVHVDLANVLAIAEALGVDLLARRRTNFKEQQAKQKARRLVGMVQGTMGLESQGVRRGAIEEMVDQTTHQLLAGSPRSLWSE